MSTVSTLSATGSSSQVAWHPLTSISVGSTQRHTPAEHTPPPPASQLGWHARNAQVGPPKPGSHRHEPSGRHSPRPLQRSAQAGSAHDTPRRPRGQWHLPSRQYEPGAHGVLQEQSAPNHTCTAATCCCCCAALPPLLPVVPLTRRAASASLPEDDDAGGSRSDDTPSPVSSAAHAQWPELRQKPWPEHGDVEPGHAPAALSHASPK